MVNTTHDTLNKNLKQEDSLINASREHILLNPNNFSRLKEQVLTTGKWLHLVKNSHKGSKIPRNLLSLDDKFLSKCLELIHLTAVKPSSIHSLSLESAKKTHFDLPFDDQINTVISQGTLQFTMKANEIPHFVYSLENQTEVYVASLSNDESSLDYIYMIYLQNGGKNGEKSSNLVGKIKVSSSLRSGNIEREFVLFSNGESLELPKRNSTKGLSKKVVEMIKNRRSKSRLSRTSFLSDSCSWEPPLEDSNHDLDQIKDIPANLETLAVVVKEEEEEVVGGWGMKFLKKSPLMSMEVVLPFGIHGGPGGGGGGGALSLVERWRNGGKCECGGWDLGCPLTVFQGEFRRNQRKESQSDLFDLFIKGSKDEIPELRIVNVQKGLYFIKFRQKLTVLQSFVIALPYIHCQCLNLRPCPVKNCTEA